ncbi:putative High mobility group box domain superfamily [Helianthus annuus]|nr:putative High mobility group box domain superfamily [Helianthus annuus]KAJ0810755.1 putative High mobility group box domain superfamily [Helianthus annuus]
MKETVKAKEPSAKKSKKERDPSKPKRPPTAFFFSWRTLGKHLRKQI